MPAYNADRHLQSVIRRIPENVWPSIEHVWIINDGSSDGTAACAEKLAAGNPKIRVVNFGFNRGYGRAAGEGLRQSKLDNCDFALCLHSDGQYPPEEIGRFVDEMAGHGIDILQGSRIASGTALSGGMPAYKYIANRILTFFENIAFGLSMTDYHSGMLAYSRRALDSLPFDKLSRSFDFDLQVIALARSRGLSVAEMAIPTRYADEISHVNVFSYGFRVVAVMAEYLAGRFRRL
jgi:glycosyltransferase involved in cell wall biosynthesis